VRRRRRISMLLVGAGLVVALAGTGGGGGRDARPTAVQIVVTRSPIAAGAAVRAGDLATVAVPQSFAMRGAVVDPASAVGARAAVALRATGVAFLPPSPSTLDGRRSSPRAASANAAASSASPTAPRSISVSA